MFDNSELVDVAETRQPTFIATYTRNGREIKVEVNPSIVTADFLEGLDTLTREERAARVRQEARQTIQTGNRATRRAATSRRGAAKLAAEGVDVAAAAQPATPDEETSLASRARTIRFMASTLGKVIVDWTLAERAAPEQPLIKIEPTEAYFLTQSFDELQPLFEWACFEAAAPGKKPSETSGVS